MLYDVATLGQQYVIKEKVEVSLKKHQEISKNIDLSNYKKYHQIN